MSVAGRLSGLGPTDPPPSIEEVGGAEAFAAEVRELPAGLMPAAVRVLQCADFPDPILVRGFIERLVDIEGAISFDEAGETLIRHVAALDDPELAIALLDQLLAAFDARDRSADLAARAGFAIQTAVDLVQVHAGASEHALIARLERVGDVPEPTAIALARAVGRVAEYDDHDFLVSLLSEKIMVHDIASAQATLELGLIALRRAFESEEPPAAAAELDEAIQLFELACDLEEGRADARVFAAAAKTVRALQADEATFKAELEALTTAKLEYEIYDPQVERMDRKVGPIHSVAAWDVLASRLRILRSTIDQPDVLHLQPGLEVMADAYAGVVLDAVLDQRTGLRAFTQPVIKSALERDKRLAMGATAYEGPGELPTAVEERGEGRPKA